MECSQRPLRARDGADIIYAVGPAHDGIAGTGRIHCTRTGTIISMKNLLL